MNRAVHCTRISAGRASRAITRPIMTAPDAAYLTDEDQSLCVYANGEGAYPRNTLWHHEIVNDTIAGSWMSVTVVALNETIGGLPTAVFHEERDRGAALAFDARVGGRPVNFDADPSGAWLDRETGSRWSVDGLAVAGPLLGTRLTPRVDAFVVFWLAWRHFQPAGSTFVS